MKPIDANKSFSELATGDWVIYDNDRKEYEALQVKRVTSTLIIVEIKNMASIAHERKFYKKDGYECGSAGSYDKPRIKPFTNEGWEDVLHERRYKAVYNRMPFVSKVDPAKIKRIYDFLIAEEFINPISED